MRSLFTVVFLLTAFNSYWSLVDCLRAETNSNEKKYINQTSIIKPQVIDGVLYYWIDEKGTKWITDKPPKYYYRNSCDPDTEAKQPNQAFKLKPIQSERDQPYKPDKKMNTQRPHSQRGKIRLIRELRT